MSVQILVGDWFERMPELASGSVQMIGPTSPPYLGLRSYLPDGHPDKNKEIGNEATPDEFTEVLVAGFREARRILRDDGIFVLNLGDSYAGSGKGPTGHNGIGDQGKRQGFVNARRPHRGIRNGTGYELVDRGAVPGCKPKDLMMVPFRVALALQADGWWLRSVLPWLKRSSMPESTQDRPSSAIEYLFLFTKSARYYWDGEAIKQPMAQPDAKVPQGFGGHKRNGGRTYSGNAYDAFQLGGRSFRNSDPFFATWQGLWCDEDGDPLALIVNPQPFTESHFATFPPGLVEPFIKAGTSEHGCCPQCGAPWRRVVERFRTFDGARREDLTAMRATDKGANPRAQIGAGNYRYGAGSIDHGWRPGCRCEAGDPVPCTVLDPFGGAGTVGLVASRLNRSAVLCELNPEYAEMARRRIAGDAPMLTADPVTVTPSQQIALWDAGEGVAG